MESRVSRAVATFEEGYNCCQSVFGTYADLFGMERETALKLSCSMGAGVGRMREVCGTVSAMALLAGLKTGNTDPQNQAAKTANYELVRTLADAFREEQGAIVCREILGIRGREKSAAPSIRTQEYYRTRPCSRTVACASRIIEKLLLPELFADTEGSDGAAAGEKGLAGPGSVREKGNIGDAAAGEKGLAGIADVREKGTIAAAAAGEKETAGAASLPTEAGCREKKEESDSCQMS